MNMKRKIFNFLTLFIMLVLVPTVCLSAKKSQNCKKAHLLPLTSVHIVDRNGFTETISTKERLDQFQNTNFLTPQPYQKVLRIYARDSQGNVRSIVTTYHDNGNPKQFLEIVNARALGNYYEWHENGKMNVSAYVIGGTADVTPLAERSWLFDGLNRVWDENEHLTAEIMYSQGVLEGVSTYFHTNGRVWKTLPYVKGDLEGCVEIFCEDGSLLQQTYYEQGMKDGVSIRYWDQNRIASQEDYCRGKLEKGLYFDKEGKQIAEVSEGTGFRAVFGKDSVMELQQFIEGNLEGEVKVFAPEGHLLRIYHVKEGIKHGEEIEYYEKSVTSQQPLQPKISFHWYEGKIQGMVKTWYKNGVLESQKEMSNNQRNGVLSAWYRDGHMMLVEEYDSDKLIRGLYYRNGEQSPISQVNEGKGLVTLFSPEGHFLQKIPYLNGKPEIPQK